MIHLGSDLHIEFGRGTLEVPGGDILLLAGDIFLPHLKAPRAAGWDIPDRDRNHNLKVIKRQEKFLSECSSKYKWVFMIAGNHEHYHGKFYETHAKIQETLDRLGCSNVKLIENDVVEFGDYILFGSTFWTDMKGGNPLVSVAIERFMNDYSLISDGMRPITADMTIAENKYARSRLRSFFDTIPSGKKPIVMTHMAPFFLSVPERFKTDVVSFGYANTNLENLIDPHEVPPTFWIHGHTHDRFTYSVGNIQVICNPRGYMAVEPMSSGFEFMELPDRVLVEAS